MNAHPIACALGVLGAVIASGTPPATSEEVKPVCASASHAVLKVQPGRDVCAPTVLANGQAVAVGFLPTACPPQAPVLAVDADGPQDLCRPRGAAARHNAQSRG
ncbi:MAG TPA: hypothetical protein VMT68_16975 [Caulobacteraceae bacterium]|nr:hypothetical protein [Caulobacteraceae bacterium]